VRPCIGSLDVLRILLNERSIRKPSNSEMKVQLDLKSKDRLYVHHVGGRAGSIGFPDIHNFRDDVFHVIYDADESCLAQIKDKWNGQHVSVLLYCLFSKNGTASFHIDYCPYISSLYPADPVYGNYYHKGQGSRDTDYVYFGALKTEKVVRVETFP